MFFSPGVKRVMGLSGPQRLLGCYHSRSGWRLYEDVKITSNRRDLRCIWWMFRCFTLKTTRLWLKCQDNPFSFEIFCPYLASVSDKLWFHDFSWLWISSDFSVFHFSLFDLVHWWFACFRCCRLLDRTSRDFTAISQAMGSVNSCETPVLTEAPVSKDKATWFNEACQTREHQFRNQRLYKNKQTVS